LDIDNQIHNDAYVPSFHWLYLFSPKFNH